MGQHGGSGVSTIASRHEGHRFHPQVNLSVWSLHILSLPVWGYSGFLPESEDMQIRLIVCVVALQ